LPSPEQRPLVRGPAGPRKGLGLLGLGRVTACAPKRAARSPHAICGPSIHLLAVAVAAPRGLGAALLGLLVAAVGSAALVLALEAGAGWMLRSQRFPGRWTRPVLAGGLTGLVSLATFFTAGGSGPAVAVFLFLGASLWSASAGLVSSRGGKAFYAAPGMALASLLMMSLCGYGAGAGLLYHLGPPLAYAVILAGHYLSGQRSDVDPGVARPAVVGYVMAATVMALLAWLDLT